MSAVPRALDSFLHPFPEAFSNRLRAWASARRVAIMGPSPRFSELRLQPYALLPELASELDSIRRTGAGDLVCILDSAGDRGLDANEARAVLDRWISVEIADRAPIEHGFRVIAAGQFREEYLGLALTLDQGCFSGSGNRRAISTLSALLEAGIVPTILFLTARSGRRCTATRHAELTRLFRRCASAGTRPGVIVPISRLIRRFGALATHVAAVQKVWPVRAKECVVQYTSPPVKGSEVERTHDAIIESGVLFDASVPVGTAADFRTFVRAGAYLDAGAYTPQRFDLRTPGGQWTNRSIVELVRVPYGAGLAAAWHAARLSRWHRLERVLDYFRIESYLRRLTDLGLAQRYHEFFVYNWGLGDPTPRTTLFDAGPLSRFDDERGLIREWRRLRDDLRPRCHIDPDGFFDAASKEARARTIADTASAVGLQHAEHRYLEMIEGSAPLRADVIDFVNALPAALGRTLEIGAGFGRLAAELTARATGYVTVDLDVSVVGASCAAARGAGAVTDFHRLPFLDGSFDSIIANNVLEHAYDPVQALSEIARTLRPGGALYALVPLDGLNPAYQLPAHLWKADLHGIKSAVVAAGLAVEAADVISLYAMAIHASFPSCEGLVCRLRARRLRRS